MSAPTSRLPRLRIAQVAPLFEAVPPAGYGGTELIVHLITEELVRRGHEVTLFASGDSRTDATLVPGTPAALWSEAGIRLPSQEVERLLAAHHAAPYSEGAAFDLIHDHTGTTLRGLRAAVGSGRRSTLFTHHGEWDPALGPLLEAFSGRHNAVSAAAARRFPERGQLPPVHHGIDVASFAFSDRSEGYLLFLGRLAPVKGPGVAVQVARRSGRRLLLAGRIHPGDRPAYERDVEPFLDGDRIRYVGEADPAMKRKLLAGAYALLFPISWEEPFGLVMIEALASGTPVVATRRASTPEVIDDGETGLLAGSGDGSEADVEALLEALPGIAALSRAACRQAAERRFTVERMVDDYERRYAEILGLGTEPTRQPLTPPTARPPTM
jgi:glycosyltransferase involved in cell wall biosynthesis